MSNKISDERKTAYYVGMAISGIGLLMFLSVFFTGIMNIGNFNNFDEQARSSGFRAFGGMALIIIGKVISGIAARGLAGSGIVLDPRKAREDLEPYSRMSGGMIKDALEESGVPEMLKGDGKPEIMIRCRACQKLNEEDSKFCQECGDPI